MGLTLTNKEMTVDIGYFGFAIIRRSVARLYNYRIGILYDKIYDPCFKGYTNEEEKYLDEHLPKYLDKFLYHSDCDGYFGIKDVKGIYRELINLKPNFENEMLNKKYNQILNIFSQGKKIYFD